MHDALAPAGSAITAHLVARGKLTQADVARGIRAAAESGERLEPVLTRLGLVAERDLAESYATCLDLPLAAAKDFPEAPVLDERLSRRFLKHVRIMPLADTGEGLHLAMADPLDDEAANAVRVAVGKPVLRRVALPADLDAAFERIYADGRSAVGQILDAVGTEDDVAPPDDLERLKDLASEAPVVRLVNALIARAVESRASDIHIEPAEGRLRVRYRIDGVLQDVDAPPLRLASAIVSRIKIMARLNIAERRLPQDERIRIPVRGRDVDFRVSTMPSMHGESVVMRILDRSRLALDFESLGFDPPILAPYLDVLARPHGILLVTGPVGSGKTTTLYASLQRLNSPARKIITVENPIEFQIDGINQIQVKPQIGLTFAAALRAILRHDFDVLMIGEIRDSETVQSAIQASLMGRLVLSTLHTNDAASSVTRLLNMGVEDYLLASTVSAIAAQRLVRTLCQSCAAPYDPPAALIEGLRLPVDVLDRSDWRRPVGCQACGSGYLGRTTVLELLIVTDRIRELVLARAEAGRIHAAAVEEGMASMFAHGMRKAAAGITTIEEVLRVTREHAA